MFFWKSNSRVKPAWVPSWPCTQVWRRVAQRLSWVTPPVIWEKQKELSSFQTLTDILKSLENEGVDVGKRQEDLQSAWLLTCVRQLWDTLMQRCKDKCEQQTKKCTEALERKIHAGWREKGPFDPGFRRFCSRMIITMKLEYF